MKKRNIWFTCTLALTVLTILLLVTGSPLLTLSLNSANSIPLGTFITWIGMICLPLSIYWGIQELRQPTRKASMILSNTLKCIIILGILWVPISYFLAGNLSFSFTEKETFQGGQFAMKWFWRLSYGIGIGSLMVLLTYWISLLFTKK